VAYQIADRARRVYAVTVPYSRVRIVPPSQRAQLATTIKVKQLGAYTYMELTVNRPDCIWLLATPRSLLPVADIYT
jgi:hypothetical protein